MEKIIEIDILNKEDLLEKYNQKFVSKKLINYLVNAAPKLQKNDKLKVIVNNQTQINDVINLIKEGILREYHISLKIHYRDNLLQFIYLLVGIFGLFLSTLISTEILKEVILIGGWVFIWALVEMEIFKDFRGRKIRRILKQLLNSEFVEK